MCPRSHRSLSRSTPTIHNSSSGADPAIPPARMRCVNSYRSPCAGGSQRNPIPPCAFSNSRAGLDHKRPSSEDAEPSILNRRSGTSSSRALAPARCFTSQPGETNSEFRTDPPTTLVYVRCDSSAPELHWKRPLEIEVRVALTISRLSLREPNTGAVPENELRMAQFSSRTSPAKVQRHCGSEFHGPEADAHTRRFWASHRTRESMFVVD